MSRRVLGMTFVGVVVLTTSYAFGQVVGPARRAAAGAAAAAGAPGVGQRIQQREAARATIAPRDRWRYVNHGNQWWYYSPKNNWMYYTNNAWTPYDAATYTGSAIPASPMVPAGYGTSADNDWRYVYNGSQWWYYTPQQSWMYFSGNRWSPYAANGNGQPRYQTGYRGTSRAYSFDPGAPPQAPVNPSAQGAAAPQPQQPQQAPAPQPPQDNQAAPPRPQSEPQAAPQPNDGGRRLPPKLPQPGQAPDAPRPR